MQPQPGKQNSCMHVVKEFFHHSWLLWNSENHELHKCYFIKFDLSVKTWQPAVSQVWEISTSCSKRWLVCALMFNFAHISWSHIWLVMTQYFIPDTMVSEFERNVSVFKLGPHFTLSGQRSLIPSLRVSLLYQTKNFHLLDSDNQ